MLDSPGIPIRRGNAVEMHRIIAPGWRVHHRVSIVIARAPAGKDIWRNKWRRRLFFEGPGSGSTPPRRA
eukprot:6919530-Alexandrium_andersonii.AAC.1